MNNKNLRLRLRSRSSLRFFLTLALTLAFFFSLNGTEGKEGGIVRFLSFHAHRYQDFEKGGVACEVFGEMENIGAKELRDVRVKVDLLDEKNKVVYSEEMDLLPRVIIFGNPKGVERSLKQSEVGVFSLNIKECPEKWLEGKIKYKFIKATIGE